ncbi:MAG TPA: amidase [Polyangiaceae bacterium]
MGTRMASLWLAGSGASLGIAWLGLLVAACGASGAKSPSTPVDAGPAIEAGNPLDYLDRPLREQVAALETGVITSAGLTSGYLARIASRDKGDGGVHAVILADPQATAHAAALDAQRGKGALLQGADIFVKDNIDTKGMATTAGSLAMTANVPNDDAFVVQRIRAAQGLVLAKTNLSEWANFRSSTPTSGWSSVGGQTYDGRNTRYDPCGSSSGSAAGVAAGLASAALGTETNGSIVCPASVNGVVGFKPTVGLVSRAGVVPISASQDTVGPITRTVGDAARMLSVIAGSDPNDPATQSIPHGMSLDFEAPLASATLKGKRLGVVTAFGFGADVMNVFNAALARMQAAGAVIVNPVSLDVSSWDQNELTILLTEFKVGINAYLAAHPEPGQPSTLADLIAYDTAHASTVMPYFGQELFTQAQATTGLSDPKYVSAKQAAQTATRGGIDGALSANNLDALISPTFDTAWVIDYKTGDPATLNGSEGPAAVAGYPHLTMPMGQVNGLPVGISFFGTAWHDAQMLALGYAFEQLP